MVNSSELKFIDTKGIIVLVKYIMPSEDGVYWDIVSEPLIPVGDQWNRRIRNI